MESCKMPKRHDRFFQAILCCTTVWAGLGHAAPVHATEATPTDGANGEILVTARKREERNIDVPLTVQAFSAATLEKNMISNVNDLYSAVPGLYFSSNLLSPGKDFIQLVIRGIGAQSAGQPAVATIVDGVYQPSLSFDTGFVDVASVQVLKGPQGTIFGRNTEGGALSITHRLPSDTTHVGLSLLGDNFATGKVQASASGKLAEGLFGAVALGGSTTDGYLKNPTLGGVSADHKRVFNGRIALRYHPAGSSLDVNLSIDGSDTKGLDGLPGVPRGRGTYEVLSTFQTDSTYKNIGGSLSIAYDLGDVTITSLTGYRKLSSYTPYDFSGGPVDGITYANELSALRVKQHVLSEELRFSGNGFGNRLHWLAGGYVFSENNTLLRRLSLAYVPAFGTSYTSNRQDQILKTTGFAFFGDGVIDLGKSFNLDLGLRYGQEKVSSDFYQDAVIPDIFYANSGSSQSTTTQYLTPSASLLYHIAPSATLYARFAQGVRAGGYPQAPTVSTNIAFKPEKTSNFEIGAKGRIAGGLLGYDISAFYIKITDQQVSSIAYVNGDPDLPAATTTNAGKSSSRGVEANIDLKPVRNLTLATNLGYTDAKYDQYIDTDSKNRAGERLPFVPRFTATGSAEYVVPLKDGRSLTLFGEYQHVGSILSGSGVDIDLQFKVRAYDLVNLRTSLVLDARTKIDLFMNNVFDRFIETKVFNTFFWGGPRPFSTVLPPRNFGARLSYSF